MLSLLLDVELLLVAAALLRRHIASDVCVNLICQLRLLTLCRHLILLVGSIQQIREQSPHPLLRHPCNGFGALLSLLCNSLDWALGLPWLLRGGGSGCIAPCLLFFALCAHAFNFYILILILSCHLLTQRANIDDSCLWTTHPISFGNLYPTLYQRWIKNVSVWKPIRYKGHAVPILVRVESTQGCNSPLFESSAVVHEEFP
mmetsp:Transcript_54344/g.122031  ORF Transcript_54344/g.122031 Transcript_54344/m.122031 type:complete len:202 (-) Transcript_54344:289-894(-)